MRCCLEVSVMVQASGVTSDRATLMPNYRLRSVARRNFWRQREGVDLEIIFAGIGIRRPQGRGVHNGLTKPSQHKK